MFHQELSSHHSRGTACEDIGFGSLWVKFCPRLQLFCPDLSEVQPDASRKS